MLILKCTKCFKLFSEHPLGSGKNYQCPSCNYQVLEAVISSGWSSSYGSMYFGRDQCFCKDCGNLSKIDYHGCGCISMKCNYCHGFNVEFAKPAEYVHPSGSVFSGKLDIKNQVFVNSGNYINRYPSFEFLRSGASEEERRKWEYDRQSKQLDSFSNGYWDGKEFVRTELAKCLVCNHLSKLYFGSCGGLLSFCRNCSSPNIVYATAHEDRIAYKNQELKKLTDYYEKQDKELADRK